jgi:murein DD-endopeptidase MepM/ murein hydrolase activator NlpD
LWLFQATVIGALVIAVLVVLGAALYAPIVRTAARVPGLNREMAQLREENAKVRELTRTLEGLEARYEQLRAMLGGDVVPQRSRESSFASAARAIMARRPDEARRYEEGLSVPRHWPIDDRGIVTRGTVAGSSGGEAHAGLDIAIPIGTPIRASGGGTVHAAGVDPAYGQFVRLTHPEGFETMYGHASRLLIGVGDTVQAGQVIALSGSTGRSTAPHLHFEIFRDGRSIDPFSLVQEGN